MCCYRRELKTPWTDRNRNEVIMTDVNQLRYLVCSIRRSQSTFFGHVKEEKKSKLGLGVVFTIRMLTGKRCKKEDEYRLVSRPAPNGENDLQCQKRLEVHEALDHTEYVVTTYLF